jgi:RecB family exonuclease
LLRVVSPSFPASYRESLVEFPQQLRNPDNKSDEDSKALHSEEQRRLLYVAITRAMDTLFLLGRGTRYKDPVPAKYLQELARESKSVLSGALECDMLQAPLLALQAAALEPPAALAEWIRLPPRPDAGLCDLSASAIDQYERCPLAFKFSRDWRIPEEAAAPMQYGAAVHTALKAYFDSVRAGRPSDTESVIACFLDEFDKAKIEEEFQRSLFQEKGRAELTRLLSSSLARPNGEIFETERQFKVRIGGAHVAGRMDRMDRLRDGEVSIIDYKTGKPKSQEDADKSLQLSVYALAAQCLGMKPGALVFLNLENGTAVESRRTTEELIKAESKVVEVAGKIADGEFEPRLGFWCRTCSYHGICPAQEVAISSPTRGEPLERELRQA